MKLCSYLIIALLLTLAACTSRQPSQITSASADNSKRERFIDSLMKLMTVEEKIGQMTLFTSDWDVTGPTMKSNYKEDIRSGKVGNIFNAYTVKYNRELQRIAVEETRMHIPLIFGYDVIHGHRTIFPIPLGESCSWDLEAMERSARIAAIEASAEGINWTFAPMVDIARDPRWGRITEGAGEDTYLGVQIAKARVRGFQGQNLADTNTIVACAKHYAAYGAAQAGRDYNTVDMGQQTLRDIYLPPFKACVDAGVGTFMTSFNEINGVPSTGSPFLLRHVLHDEWNFKGFVVTDYTGINEMVPHGFAEDEKQAGEEAVNAGVDMDMQGAVYYNYLKKSLEEGKVKQEDIDEAVRRILRIKYDLGLFADPYRYFSESREATSIMTQANLDAARDIARKSCVLLKNENNVLPLKNETAIALIGPLANSKTDMIGSWSAGGDGTKAISLLEGIQARPGTKMVYAKGCNINDDTTKYFAQAIAAAKSAQVVVMVLGENRDMSGEAASRSDITLPGVQQQLFDEIAKTGKPVVVVLMNGRPLAIPDIDAKASAILEAWFGGTMAGHAVADVLYGDYNPSGKLTATFPRSVGQIPLYYNAKNTGRPFDANNKYTSKYLDIPNTPLYPFGYGLSYTTFEYSDLKLDKPVFNFSDSLKVSVTLKNTGARDGEEIVQLYTHDLVGSVTRPVRELKGFQKIALKAGEIKTVTFTLRADDLAFTNSQLVYQAEPGKFEVFAGPNSASGLKAEFELVK
ncbi:MAG: beta-glucosidase BglX [Chitinophagales bacterium]|nr:beta-glucosidase BglX [Chitinophagales bacterium]